MCLTCQYCGRACGLQVPRPFDPHGCFGCTTRLPNLSICQICGCRLPITADGRRYVVRYVGLCETCGAPLLPTRIETTERADAGEPVLVDAGG
jgi:hypothetical protein